MPAQDVCKPEAPRLRKQLSAIVNFARHREHKVAFWVDAAEQTAQAQEEAAEMQEAKDRAVSCLDAASASGLNLKICQQSDSGPAAV